MPTIEQFKESAGFPAGRSALYTSWRSAAKQQMTHLGITGRADAGREKWAELTAWALGKRPLSEQATLHSSTSEAGRRFAQAVHGLLKDVAKKQSHTRSRQVALTPPPQPEAPKHGLYSFLSLLFTGLI